MTTNNIRFPDITRTLPEHLRHMSPDSIFNPIIQQLVTLFLGALPWVVFTALALGALRTLLTPRFKGIKGERQVGHVLERYAAEVLHDIVLPDGRDGLTQIDHVALTQAGLLVVETKNYGGSIFGSEHDAQWTQKIGRQTHRFQNPQRQNHAHVQAVQALRLGVPVFGWVVFTDAAKFPKGIPNGVSQRSNLENDLNHAFGSEPPPDTWREGWDRLKMVARTDRTAHQAHLADLKRRHGPNRRQTVARGILVVSLAGLSIMWLSGMRPLQIPATSQQPRAETGLQQTVPFPNVLRVPQNDLAYAGRIAAQLQNTPRCLPYQQRIMEAGKAPPAAATKSAIIKAYNTAKDAGCGKRKVPSTQPRQIITGAREVWVPGRPLEQCLGPDRELNVDVLRCREGHKEQVPVYAQ